VEISVNSKASQKKKADYMYTCHLLGIEPAAFSTPMRRYDHLAKHYPRFDNLI
jgi:hypothetical protein